MLYKQNKVNFTFVYVFGLISIGGRFKSAFVKKGDYLEQSLLLLPAIITTLHFLFYIIYRFIIRKLLSFSGVGKHKHIANFDALTRNGVNPVKGIKGDLLFKNLKFSPELERRFVFPIDELTKRLTGEINYITFSDTVWSGNDHSQHDNIETAALAAKIDRNLAHLNRNSRSIMLIKNKIGHWMGFTHVITVTSFVWEKYLRGEIADVTFPVYDVCEEKQAYGLIIFSIGNLLKFSKAELPLSITHHLSDEIIEAMAVERERYKEKGPKHYDNYLRIIYKGVLFQINELLKSNFGHSKIIPVLIQIEDEGIRHTFESNNFIKQKTKSADGLIYMLPI